MASLVFTIEIWAQHQDRGDGNNENYVAQTTAPNGEKLSYRGEAPTISAAIDELNKQVKFQEAKEMRAK